MTQRGLPLIIYGTEGVGKTSFCLQFKKDILCLSIKEQGFENLRMVGDIPEGCDNEEVESFNHLIKLIKGCKDYSTLVIDSLSGIQQLAVKDIISTVYLGVDNPEGAFASFYSGFKQHAPIWMERVCDELTLLNSRGVNTLLIGHVRSEVTKNPSGNDYNSAVIDMESWPRAVFAKWAGAILYMTLDLEVMVTKSWKGKPVEGKAKQDLESDSDRVMYTTKNPSHSAKNLYHLPPYISLGDSATEAYSRFFSHLPPIVQEAQK